jgi:acyl carrier protein
MGNEQGRFVPDPSMLVLRRHFPLLGPYVPPRTPTEQKLADIWCQVLTMDEIGILDKYEHLSGDSLLAASMFAEIEKTFEIIIPTGSLIDAPTIGQLAQTIDTAISRRVK